MRARTISLLLASVLVGSCSTRPGLLEQISNLGELRVVTRNSPTTFYVGTREDEYLGPEYDLALGLAHSLGVRLRIIVVPDVEQIYDELKAGRAHIAAAGLTPTPERRQQVRFGPGYQSVSQYVVYRVDHAAPTGPQSLVDSRISVLKGSNHAELLRELKTHYPGLSWQEDATADAEDLLARVDSGELDYTIVNSQEFALSRQYHPNLRRGFQVGEAAQLSWALPPSADQAFRERVAGYFARIRATGVLAKVLSRHYSHTDTFDYVGSLAFVHHFSERLPLYRDAFIKAGRDTGLDWRLLAAMAYQESHWNPKAVSPTGVRGLMMLTESTASMMEVDNRLDPDESIEGGARYLRRVIGKIPTRIAEPDRTWLALAAYNIGFGHLEDARILTETTGDDPDSWDAVREHLPLLTQSRWFSRVKRGFARGWQPVHYVENIRRYYNILKWMTSTDRYQTDENIERSRHDFLVTDASEPNARNAFRELRVADAGAVGSATPPRVAGSPLLVTQAPPSGS